MKKVYHPVFPTNHSYKAEVMCNYVLQANFFDIIHFTTFS